MLPAPRGSMSKQQYVWMLGLIAAWRQQQSNSDDPDGARMLLQHVFAQAGQFTNAPAKSANDQVVACLFILLLLWWRNSAKNSANFAGFHLVFCKINADRFFPDSARNPRQLAVPEVYVPVLISDKSITSPQEPEK